MPSITAVLTQAKTNHSNRGDSSAVYCKLLTQREAYTSCHVWLPEETRRVSAIALDGCFYSFFKVVESPAKALAVAARLGRLGDHVAITHTKRGYVLWILEPQAQFAPPKSAPQRPLKPAFGPAACCIASDPAAYERCSIHVPDLDNVVPGICCNGRLYSIFRQEKNAAEMIVLAAKLGQRRDETLIAPTPDGFILGVYEANADRVVR